MDSVIKSNGHCKTKNEQHIKYEQTDYDSKKLNTV